jgi:type VI secretion system secreted protein VgrG
MDQSNRFIAIEISQTPLGQADAARLGLVSFTGSEQLSRLSQFEAQLASEDDDINFDDVMGHPITLTLNTRHGGKRYFHGLVSRFEQLPSYRRYAHYQATIVPWLWFLTRTSDCRIYQNKTIPQIVDDVFRRHSFHGDCEWRVDAKSHTAWENCVQYNETDFNFVSRLLEQEGIYYFFKHEEKRHLLVFCDGPSRHERFPGYDEIIYHPAADGPAASEYIRDWSFRREIQTTAFEHNDYDFIEPSKPLKTNDDTKRHHGCDTLPRFDHPSDCTNPGHSKAWATIRLQELQAGFEIAGGSGDNRGLAPGFTFKLKEHPRKHQPQEFLVLATHYSADAGQFESEPTGASEGAQYECSFEVIDASVNYRPPRITPKPVIYGVQTAVVTGPAGQEIYVDKYGQIKVQFHWDRHGKHDENSSCWIRVSQSWTGKGWGHIANPHITEEVIVAFLEGDPDRPIIVGRVYNADHMPPYPLPQAAAIIGMKSQSSKTTSPYSVASTIKPK